MLLFSVFNVYIVCSVSKIWFYHTTFNEHRKKRKKETEKEKSIERVTNHKFSLFFMRLRLLMAHHYCPCCIMSKSIAMCTHLYEYKKKCCCVFLSLYLLFCFHFVALASQSRDLLIFCISEMCYT